jgi:hypothetical protein
MPPPACPIMPFPHVPPTAAMEQLRDALAQLPGAAYAGDGDAVANVERLMCEVVDELKHRGMAPEHVLLAVKGVAFEAGLGLTSATLMERMVTRCIEQYFTAR